MSNMPLSRQRYIHRVSSRRRFAAWACALVLLLQGLAPIIAVSARADTDVPQTSAFADLNYICTAYGIQTIAHETASDTKQAVSGGYCPLCQIHNLDLAITPPAPPSVITTQARRKVGAPIHLSIAQDGRVDGLVLPRAPPSHS